MIYDLNRFALGEAPESILKKNMKQVTFPDLHGNALALLFRLEAHGIIELTEQQRKNFSRIYLESESLSLKNFQEFKRVLNTIQIYPNQFECVRFIGDVLADRGKNDALTLLVLKKLHDSHVKITILFSNHDLEFITWRLSHQINDDEIKNILGTPRVEHDQRRSINHLIEFIENFNTENEINKLIDEIYKPLVKLFDYSLNETVTPPIVTFYTHTPVGLEAVALFAKMYNIVFDISTPQKLFKMIDQINQTFSHELMSEPDQLGKRLAFEFLEEEVFIPEKFPFWYLAWNRLSWYHKSLTDQSYVIQYVHGHMGAGLSIWTNTDKHSGLNLDDENTLGYSEPETDEEFPYGFDADSLNSYLSPDS